MFMILFRSGSVNKLQLLPLCFACFCATSLTPNQASSLPMSYCENFNPYLKRKRIHRKLANAERKLERAERELKQLKTASTEMETQITCIKQQGYTRNILLDAPAEIIVKIMKLLKDESDIMALYDLVPRMKRIFQQNNLAKFFFERDYPRVTGIRNIAGFICSGRTHEPVNDTTLPAGKYMLGNLTIALHSDIIENVLKNKLSYRWLDREGVYIVRDDNRHKFIVYNVCNADKLEDDEGWNYFSRIPPLQYMACVPFSLASRSKRSRKKCKIIDSISPIKCTFAEYGDAWGSTRYKGVLHWNDRVHGNKTLKWKAYESDETDDSD